MAKKVVLLFSLDYTIVLIPIYNKQDSLSWQFGALLTKH